MELSDDNDVIGCDYFLCLPKAELNAKNSTKRQQLVNMWMAPQSHHHIRIMRVFIFSFLALPIFCFYQFIIQFLKNDQFLVLPVCFSILKFVLLNVRMQLLRILFFFSRFTLGIISLVIVSPERVTKFFSSEYFLPRFLRYLLVKFFNSFMTCVSPRVPSRIYRAGPNLS